MKTIKIDEIEISNESKICFFAGLNILETSELAKEVAFNLKGITEKLGNPLFLKPHSTRQTDLQLIPIGVLD